MAIEGEKLEYESDPEEAIVPLTMRRRVASDDEDGDGEEREKQSSIDLRVGIGSDGESDGQGGAPGYEDYESQIEEEEEEDGGVEEVEEFEERVSEGGEDDDNARVEIDGPDASPESGGDGRRSGGEETGKNEGEEEKKESEPFSVPTAGAFYMHDDRFRNSGGGRHRRTPGGRKLWESKDDRAWVHDRFEEMNLQDAYHAEERRTSKGHFRGRGKNRGMDRGYVKGNRSRGYDDTNNQNNAPKVVRGRGPKRYVSPAKNNRENHGAQNRQYANNRENHGAQNRQYEKNRQYANNRENHGAQNRQYGKSFDTTSNTSSGRLTAHTPNVQTDPIFPRKNVFASSLSSASPPFYPSGSSNQDSHVKQKDDTQTGSINRNLSPSVVLEENISASRSGALLRGKTVVDPMVQDRHYMDDPIDPISGKPLTNMQLQPFGSSSPVSTTQLPQSRVQGRGLSISGQLNYQPTSSLNQGNRASSHAPVTTVPQRSTRSPVQPALQPSTQQLGQRLGSGTQVSSPPQGPSTNSSEVGDVESPPGSSKSKTALVGKGKSSIQGSGMGSFLYNGAQVIGATGAMGVSHGDQNFPPGLLPVMQFGGQHHGGLGVPAVGMAFPGYVAQPQLGLGNSEMTWMPVLAGAAGALGATYGSPYFAVDGGYYARPSGQTSSMGASREASSSKPNNGWKPSQRPELVNDEFGQRQNKPRRYSEMSFSQ
ncbi:protein MLN51 homolog isoform X2 [Tasmannia lanceolata]|uniref:protein MLN51 homolog isoform X2 n=1 Tax=Tasmannia lanceolata TaxID=3420 RepID=UPI0040632CEA